MFIRTVKTLNERDFAAYPHKVAYGFGRIRGPKYRRLGSVDGCANMFKGDLIRMG